MFHEPANYQCPFCEWLAGHENEHKQNTDIVYQDAHVTAFVSPKWWTNNPGSVIVIPNIHTENIYSIDEHLLASIYSHVKAIAYAIRTTYPGCAGTSTRQHNEPDGNQSVWHFHTHVLPRYPGDALYENHAKTRFVDARERKVYADMLHSALVSHASQDA